MVSCSVTRGLDAELNMLDSSSSLAFAFFLLRIQWTWSPDSNSSFKKIDNTGSLFG